MDWETIYRGWKQGLGWTNRREMFGRCMVWLGKFQEGVWRGRPWGRTANYAVVPRRMVNQVAPAGGDGEVAGVEEVESEDVPGYLAQFQWPT